VFSFLQVSTPKHCAFLFATMHVTLPTYLILLNLTTLIRFGEGYGSWMWAGKRSRYSDWLQAGRSGDRILVGGEIFPTCPDWPWGPPHPASCTMGTGSFPGVKGGWGVMLTPHPLLVPWSRKSRATPMGRTTCRERDADPSPPSSPMVMKE